MYKNIHSVMRKDILYKYGWYVYLRAFSLYNAIMLLCEREIRINFHRQTKFADSMERGCVEISMGNWLIWFIFL